MPTVSLIICTYQRPESVRRLLDSIKDQSALPDEIIVVDASLDGETESVIKKVTRPVLDRLIYIHTGENDRGLTRQRNVGTKKASGEIIAFLDDDTVPEKDYFEQLVACFDRHPEAIGVGGQITTDLDWRPANLEKKPSFAVFRWENWEKPESIRGIIRKLLGLASNLPPGWMPPFGHGRPSSYPPDGNDHQVEFIIGASSAWKAEIFKEIQFSTFFYDYGLYEDLDFCIRAGRLGSIYLSTSSQLEHYHAPGGRPNPFSYGKMVTRNGWYVWRQRWPNPRWTDRAKWWVISLLMTLLRLIDFRNSGFKEAMGRITGLISILISSPKLNED